MTSPRQRTRRLRTLSVASVTLLATISGLPAHAAEPPLPPSAPAAVGGMPAQELATSSGPGSPAPAAETATYTVSVPTLRAGRWSVPAETGSVAFDTAYAQVGVPYRFAGASPAGFDCSGLIKYAYAAAGVALPHSAGAQARLGTPVPRDQARYGDIIYMPGHIGFWAGPGLILDAPQAGGMVSVRPIWTDAYQVIRIGN